MKTYAGRNAPLPGTDHPANAIDLCVHLGREGRFGGWGNTEWTVLHHSMLVSLLWLRSFGPAGVHHALLHDSHEYITGDIPSPVKAFMGPALKAVEEHIDNRVKDLLHVAPADLAEHNKVKLVDQAALIIEAYYFGTPGSFPLIGRENWGKNVGKTDSEKLAIRAVIEGLCPEIIQEMDALQPSPGRAGGFEAAYP